MTIWHMRIIGWMFKATDTLTICNTRYFSTATMVPQTPLIVTLYIIQGDSFGTGLEKMRISQRLFIRFCTCIYDYRHGFMRY
jgi:hypothetical protein